MQGNDSTGGAKSAVLGKRVLVEKAERNPLRRADTGKTVVNTIFEGFDGGRPSNSARKTHLRAIQSVYMIIRRVRLSMSDITFTDRDF